MFFLLKHDNKQYIAILVPPLSSLLGAELLGFVDDDIDFSECGTSIRFSSSATPSDSHVEVLLLYETCPFKFIPSGTVEYGQLNMATYSTIALHTFSME